jgi:hypothetical protein
MENFPTIETSDDLELLEENKNYKFIIGKLFPVFRDTTGKVVEENNPEARLDAVGLPLWCTEKIVLTPEGTVEFSGQAKITEYFPMPKNKNFEAIKWKAKAFFHSFVEDEIVVGEKGNKQVNFEKVKNLYGRKITVQLSKNNYGLNINYRAGIVPLEEKRTSPEILEKIEQSYDELKKAAAKQKAEKVKSQSPVEEVPF